MLFHRVPPGECGFTSSDGTPGTNGATSKTRCGMWNKDYFDRIARGELMRRQMTNYRMTNDEGSPNGQMARQHAARVSFGLCHFSRSVTPLLQLAVGDFVGQLVTAASLFRGEFGRQ